MATAGRDPRPPWDDGRLLVEFLTRLGARELVHRQGSSLFDHLIATADILRAWSQPDHICSAGAVHSIYGTEAYHARLVDLDCRREIAGSIGAQAERLAYLFSTTQRAKLFDAVRVGIPNSATAIGGETVEPDEAAGLVLLHMANLIEQATVGNPGRCLGQILSWGRILRRGQDRIPAFIEVTRPPTVEEEQEICRQYKSGLAHMRDQAVEEATLCFDSATALCPSLAEPVIWLAYLSLRAGYQERAAEQATRGKGFLEMWGVPWDKRLSFGQWTRLASLIENASGMKVRPELPWPDPDALPTVVSQLATTLEDAGVGARPGLGSETKSARGQNGDVRQQEPFPRRFSAYLAQLISGSKPRGGIRYPGLSSAPWHDPSKFAIVDALESQFPVLKEEVLDISSFQNESEPIGRTGTWHVAFLYECGKRQDDVCSRCPTLTDIINAFPTIRTMAGLIYISRLAPGTTIRPHRATTNVRLRCHLAVKVPPAGCGIIVGGEARSWEEGKCLVFDDCFEHHAWNRSTEDRIVVIIDLWHPDLSDEEIVLLSGLHNHVASQAGWLNRYYASNARARLQADDERSS
jgi:hypothetical protein